MFKFNNVVVYGVRYSLWLVLLIIIAGHGILLWNYFSRYDPAEDAVEKKAIHELSWIFSTAATKVPATVFSKWAKDIDQRSLQLGNVKMTLYFSNAPDYTEEREDDETQLFSSRWSKKIDSLHWLNYRVAIKNEPYFYLVSLTLFEFILFAFYLFYTFSLYRFKVPLKNFKLSAEKLGIDLNTGPVKFIGGPLLAQEAAEAINKMQARIQELINTRTRMLASISHDLKTPITRLKLRTHLLQDSAGAKATLRDLDEMEQMINSILSFSYQDVLREKKKNIELVSLLSTLCEDYADQGHTLTFNSSAKRILFFGGRLSLKRAISNLIQNSIKYASKVFVDINQDKQMITISIEDNGPGIAVEELDKVLEPFYRSNSARFQQQSGTGLGLSIAREIITAHGGKLVLSNRKPIGLQARIALFNFNN